MIAAESRLLGQAHDPRHLDDGPFPGTSTAPATRTRTRFDTGAMKQDRNTGSHAAKVGGIRRGSDAVTALGRCGATAIAESSRTAARRVCR
jgi:hypothetical protein